MTNNKNNSFPDFVKISEAYSYDSTFTPSALLQYGIKNELDIYLCYDFKQVKCSYRKNENGKISIVASVVRTIAESFPSYEGKRFWKIKDRYYIDFRKYSHEYLLFKRYKDEGKPYPKLQETFAWVEAVDANSGFEYEQDCSYLSTLLTNGKLEKKSRVLFEPEEIDGNILIEPYAVLKEDRDYGNFYVGSKELFALKEKRKTADKIPIKTLKASQLVSIDSYLQREQKYLIQSYIKSLLNSGEDEFSFREIMRSMEQALESKIKQYEGESRKLTRNDFLSLSSSFYFMRFLKKTCCSSISKRELQKAERSLSKYFNEVKLQLKAFKKNNPSEFSEKDMSVIEWVEILQMCEYVNIDIAIAHEEMKRRVLCVYFKLDYYKAIRKIRDYSKCNLQEAVEILGVSEDELIKLCLNHHEFGAYIEVSRDCITSRRRTNSISDILSIAESDIELKNYQYSYDGLARLIKDRQDDYEEITLEHLRKGGVIKAREKRDILFFQNSLSDFILNSDVIADRKDRSFYVDLQKTKL